MAEAKTKMDVYKFTLTSKKVIYLKEPKIADTEAAMKVAGKMAGNDNPGYLSVMFQKELVKILLVKVNKEMVSMAQKELLDDLLTIPEYAQVTQAVKQIAGDAGEQVTLTPEITTL